MKLLLFCVESNKLKQIDWIYIESLIRHFYIEDRDVVPLVSTKEIKLFNEDGSHYEVRVGAWLIKTPDSRIVASQSTFVPKSPEHEWTKEEIQDIVFNDFGHYNGFDRALLLMKTDEIINEIINQISIGGSSNGE